MLIIEHLKMQGISNILLTLLKWIFILLFFPLSLLFIAYFRQRKAKKLYFSQKDENDKL